MTNRKKSVVQDWLSELTWKQQTVLFCALRGPDTGGSPEVKKIVRWLRSIILENAAPNKTFMKETGFKKIIDIAEDSPLCFDMLPTHCLGHILHAMEVIGYFHPNEKIAQVGKEAYFDLCEFLHVEPESSEKCKIRLSDEI